MIAPRARTAILGVCLLSAAGSLSAATPEIDYMLNCMGCHLAEGQGAPDKIPSLKGYVARFLSVPEGRQYLIQIPGVTQSSLDDAEIAALTNWLLARFDGEHLPADFAPYTAEEVARYRSKPLTDVAGTRARLIERLEHAQSAR